MHVERFSHDFHRIITIADPAERVLELAVFLESHGYQYGARSADNILLLQPFFSVDSLHRIVINSLLTPTPDLALNAFERLAGVIPPADLAELALRKRRLAQFILVCGSSPFLVNQIYKTPDALRKLFLENNIDVSRSAEDMLSAIRSRID
ncbi:MAG: bifunctional [glutamate--ammonia ligase]-adenylyl-L-tyrosine phosphorylase/[glutamate--ammonia-ligase] adenylyltransferase, partial [Deltaproteobacteria bacterium]|nr:bifunctional [glutamate--ammonia ligase]-adenylyl-L-tyrosine phosphorylase/[glutamate--ammonia-ligase] adenylyltransferase [Deltaproteobacteria bacterium]